VPDRFRHSPDLGKFPAKRREVHLPGLSAGTERFYVLFPRTEVDLSEAPSESSDKIEVLSNDLILVHMYFSGVLDDAYFDSLKRGILYWNGRQWTGTPSRNQQDP
jgi:hypothetical protein